jgi:hypothetical protein
MSKPQNGDTMGNSNSDAPQPRLVSARQIRREQALKDELYGTERPKVTLPRFSWDKDDNSTEPAAAGDHAKR